MPQGRLLDDSARRVDVQSDDPESSEHRIDGARTRREQMERKAACCCGLRVIAPARPNPLPSLSGLRPAVQTCVSSCHPDVDQ